MSDFLPKCAQPRCGRNIKRAEMWITHKRKNGTYVNGEAMEIGVNLFLPLNCLFNDCIGDSNFLNHYLVICTMW